MKDPLMLMIIIFNFIILAPISVILRSWRERGTLTEKKFAITLTAYFSFSFVTPLIPVMIGYPQTTALVDAGALLVLWCIGYPCLRWLYRQFDSPRRR